MQVVAFEDLYGGKLHAALDRQHPRDFYDVKLLYANEGLTDSLFRVFLVYVAASGRPMHELLAPARSSIEALYTEEFETGRASCRERVCQYGYIPGFPVSLKKKKHKNEITIQYNT